MCSPTHSTWKAKPPYIAQTSVNTGDGRYNCSTWNNFEARNNPSGFATRSHCLDASPNCSTWNNFELSNTLHHRHARPLPGRPVPIYSETTHLSLSVSVAFSSPEKGTCRLRQSAGLVLSG